MITKSLCLVHPGLKVDTKYSFFFLNGINFYFFNFILFLNFTILYWFCHISKWIHHRHIRDPHPEPSSLLPPHTIPLGRPSAPAPSIQYRASYLDWWLVSYMILYEIFLNNPLKFFLHGKSFSRLKESLFPTNPQRICALGTTHPEPCAFFAYYHFSN